MHCLFFLTKCLGLDIQFFLKSMYSTLVIGQDLFQEDIQKCSKLWNKINRPKSSEIIKSVLGCQLKYPVETRWNSFYDSICSILVHKDKLNGLCEKLEIQILAEKDIKYLEDYKKLLGPIAEAIDFLQGNEGIVYVFLLPSLAAIRIKIVKMQKHFNNKYLESLASTFLKEFEKRFKLYFDLDLSIHDAIVASVLCPEVKLSWAPSLKDDYNNMTKNDIINIVKDALLKEDDNTSISETSIPATHKFFDFSLTEESLIGPHYNVQHSDANEEFLAYLSDPATSVQMLNMYPLMKIAYLHYNVSLPSSAAVEPLFSLENMLNAPRRGNLSDEYFEMLLLLKANNSV